MSEGHVNVVQVDGDEGYERIWELVRQGAVVTVEFLRDGDQRMLATTSIVDHQGVTLDRTALLV
jgi:hypothetical protein